MMEAVVERAVERSRTVMKTAVEWRFHYRHSIEMRANLVRVYVRRKERDYWNCANSLVLSDVELEAFKAAFPHSQFVEMSSVEKKLFG